MRKTKIFTLALLLIVLAAVICAIPSASANSAQRYWYGVSSSGSIIVGDKVPIAVKSEKIVFDIQNFPQNHYASDENVFEDYNAFVSATYEFENTADYEVNVRLAFPYGTFPSYFYYLVEKPDTPLGYSVTVNGEKTETVNRYTYSVNEVWYEGYDNEKAVEQLLDEKKSVRWINKDAKVVKYTYKVENSPYGDYYAFVGYEKNGTSAVYSDYSFYRSEGDKIEYGNRVFNGSEIQFWVVYSGVEPEIDLYAKKDIDKSVIEECVFEQTGREEFTLDEYADSSYILPDGTESSRVDWFNVVIDYIANNDTASGRGILFSDVEYFVKNYVMRWYEYGISIPAGETAVNTVTAPLFPSINEGWNPAVYEYGYLLSPAKDWAAFGDLDIEVITPFKMLEADKNGFEKTENGYKAHFDSLPEGDLTFRISESENPVKVKDPYFSVVVTYIALYIYPVIGIAETAVIIAFAVSMAKRKNAKALTDKERKNNTLRAAGVGFVAAFAALLSLALVFVILVAGFAAFEGAVIFAVAGVVLSAIVTTVTVFVCKEKKAIKNNDEEGKGD